MKKEHVQMAAVVGLCLVMSMAVWFSQGDTKTLGDMVKNGVTFGLAAFGMGSGNKPEGGEGVGANE